MMELGQYNHLGKQIPYKTKRRNFLFVGSSQTGKSETLIRLALNDIHNEKNIIFIGSDSTDEILKHIPNKRQAETTYCNPSLQPFAFNPFANVPANKHKALANSFIDTIHTLLTYDGSTPTLDDYLRVSVLTLLSMEAVSPISIYFLLTDKKYRAYLPSNVKDKFLLAFWERFETLTPKEKRQEISSTLNKLSVFIFDPVLRNCLVQPENHISLQNPVTLVSLDEMDLGEDSTSFIGALMLASLNAQESSKVTIYIDNASRYGSRILSKLLKNSSFTTILAVHALDDFPRLNDILKSADIVALRTSFVDAERLKKEIRVQPQQVPINSLEDHQAYIMHGESAYELDLPLHEYEKPTKPRNTKKPVEKRVIDRCAGQCTLSDNKIKERLGRFF
jgi:hypothetical protein